MLNMKNIKKVLEDFINNKQCIKKSKEFWRQIFIYNNLLFFYSKSANLDYKNSM